MRSGAKLDPLRRLCERMGFAALGKMHRFNDLPWNPAHRDIREPLEGLLRERGRPDVIAQQSLGFDYEVRVFPDVLICRQEV
jgi:hypothetical protein